MNQSYIITEFQDEYRFLSNFYRCPVTVDGITFPASENAFQYFKVIGRGLEHELVNMSPSASKAFVRKFPLPSDWELNKDNIMLAVVHAKFNQNQDLKDRLRDTAPALLMEGNRWGDNYWGCVPDRIINPLCWTGRNQLGKILMNVRKWIL